MNYEDFDLIPYLGTIHDRIRQSYFNKSINEFWEVATEVSTFYAAYPDKTTMYDKEHTNAEVFYLNALKTFLVASKNYPGNEQQEMRKNVFENHYKPLADKFGITHY